MKGRQSIWADIPRRVRLSLLEESYDLVREFEPGNALLAPALFGVALDRSFRADWTEIERERFAYEVLLNKFDVMLKRVRQKHSLPNRGLVIHDRRVVAERDIQQWTAEWRAAAGAVGQLRNLADVPLFSDSRATRLLQVADLVAYAVFRRYNPENPDGAYIDRIWPTFHEEDGVVHGCVHYTPAYGAGGCSCPPCHQRLIAEAGRAVGAGGGRPRKRRGERARQASELDAGPDASSYNLK